MITLKFSSNGQQVEATTDSAAEAMSLLSSMAPAKVTRTYTRKAKTATPAKAQKVRKARTAHTQKPWTKDEVKALFEHRMLKPRFLSKVPALQGRSKVAIATYARFIKNPSRMDGAPAHFRNLVTEVAGRAPVTAGPTPHTGLLD